MNRSGILIRWIYAACYEIILPGGQVIVIDPYVTPLKMEQFSVNDFTGADYIICTHTHYDHTADIAYLADKFHSKVIAGHMGVPCLAEFFGINYNYLYPMSPNEVFEFPDITVQAMRAKHNLSMDQDRGQESSSSPLGAAKLTMNAHRLSGYGLCDQIGWIESYDLLITIANNMRILIVSGDPILNNIYRLAQQMAPDIVIRQASSYKDPHEYARAINRFGAQVAFPHHHEIIPYKYGIDTENYMQNVDSELKAIGSHTIFINPVQCQWYRVAISVEIAVKE